MALKLAFLAASGALFLLCMVSLSNQKHTVELEQGIRGQITEEGIWSAIFGRDHASVKAVPQPQVQQLRYKSRKAGRSQVSMSTLMHQYKQADSDVEKLQALLKKAKKNQKYMHYVESPAFWGGGVVDKVPPKP